MASMDFRTGTAYHREPPPRTPNDTLKLSGSICALATPFTADASALDLDAFGRLIDHQLEGGTRALVVAGRPARVRARGDEFVSSLPSPCSAGGRVPVLAGSGPKHSFPQDGCADAARRRRRPRRRGGHPGHVRPTQEGLYRHFNEVAATMACRSCSQRRRVRPATCCRRRSRDFDAGIIGIKEAVADARRMQALLRCAARISRSCPATIRPVRGRSPPAPTA